MQVFSWDCNTLITSVIMLSPRHLAEQGLIGDPQTLGGNKYVRAEAAKF